MKEPFLSAVPVIEQLEHAGYEAYFVGGSVRDHLLNRPIHDIDIATSATPSEVKQIFSKTVDVGIEHGTVLVIYQNQSYELTTFRMESEYQDFRRPKEVAFTRNLRDDLERRDFTMNAIAMDRTGKLIDPFHGQSSIMEKVILTVGSAEDRFQEDALRMMRAVRFVSQLSFQVDEEVLTAISKLVPLLDKIAVERKLAEFEKLLSGVNRKEALELIIITKISGYLPGLKNKQEALEKLSQFNMQALTSRELWALLIFCLGYQGKSIEIFLRDWRLPLKEIRTIQLLVVYVYKRLEQDWLVYDLYTAGKDICSSAEKIYHVIKGNDSFDSLEQLQNRFSNLPIKDRSELAVTGQDLMDWLHKSGGPWLRETLQKIEMAVLTGELENRNLGIKEWLLKCNPK